MVLQRGIIMVKRDTLNKLKQQERQIREDLIIDAARTVFGAKTYDQVSMNEIAKAAGIAKSSIYTYFPNQEALFVETADNEREHAKRFFKFLEGGDLEIQASYPAGKIGTTVENLKAAAAGENEEWTELYPAFAAKAKEEGLAEVAAAFTMIAKAEKEHEARYLKLAENVEKGTVFKKESAVRWKCRNCGYVHEGPEAPAKCPACLHAQEHFELKETTY
jgi:rubrerythrin